jgi:hypothetical protein
MGFDRRKYPNAVTIGGLIANDQLLGVSCHKCGRHAVFDPKAMPFRSDVAVPELAGRFKCSRCGSKDTEARPEFPKPRYAR